MFYSGMGNKEAVKAASVHVYEYILGYIWQKSNEALRVTCVFLHPPEIRRCRRGYPDPYRFQASKKKDHKQPVLQFSMKPVYFADLDRLSIKLS